MPGQGVDLQRHMGFGAADSHRGDLRVDRKHLGDSLGQPTGMAPSPTRSTQRTPPPFGATGKRNRDADLSECLSPGRSKAKRPPRLMSIQTATEASRRATWMRFIVGVAASRAS